MSAMPTPPDPRDEATDSNTQFRQMLEDSNYTPEQIEEMMSQKEKADRYAASLRGENIIPDLNTPEGEEWLRRIQEPPNMGAGAQSIRAMTPEEEGRFNAEIAEEEDFQDFLRTANALGPMPNDTPGMRVWNRLAYGYARSQSIWGPAQQWVADIPIIGDPIAGVLRGGERGSVSVNNFLMGLMGYDLDQMPSLETYQEPMEDFGVVGELSQGITQFAFVAVPVAATLPASTGSWLTMAVAGAVADATAFDPREGNISTMAREMFPDTAVADMLRYTDSKELYELTGNQWYARAMAAGEGFVVGETAGLTLGSLITGFRGWARTAGDIAAEANPGMGGAGGMLGDFGIPPEIASRVVDPSAFYHLKQLRALTFARNARAQALINANPGMSNKQMLDILTEEFGDLPHALDLQRKAWADVMFELHKGTPQEMSKEAWNAMSLTIEPDRTFMSSVELSPGSDWTIFQRSAGTARAGTAAAKGVDEVVDSAPTSRRFSSATIQSQIDEFATANDLSPEQTQHLVDGIREAMKGEPLETWQTISIRDLDFAEGVAKFDENGMPNFQFAFDHQHHPGFVGNAQPGSAAAPKTAPSTRQPETLAYDPEKALEEAQARAAELRAKADEVGEEMGPEHGLTREADDAVAAADEEVERLLSERDEAQLRTDYSTSGETAESLEEAATSETADVVTEGGDRRFFEAETDDDGVVQVIRGAADIDMDEGIAFIRLFDEADPATAVHELGHAALAQTMGRRAKRGMGSLTPDDIAEVEASYGVKDGVWSDEQAEKFAADFVKWIEEGGPRSAHARSMPKNMQRAFAMAAAGLRSVDRDTTGLVEMTPAARDALDKISSLNGLPERYAPNRYVETADFSAVWARVQEAEAAGQDWRDVVRPEDILGTARMSKTGRLRFDASTPEEAQALIAHFNAFVREGLESGVLLRGRTLEDMREGALRTLNEMMGRDEVDLPNTMKELLGSVDMTRTGTGALDEKLLTAQMLLHFKADALVKMAEQAGRTRKVTDMALLHRAALEYQVVQAQISSAYTNWGRAGQAMQGVKLPSPDELTNPEMAEKFLVSIGMPPGALVGDSDTLINALAHARLPEDYATIAKVSGDVSQQRSMYQKVEGFVREYYVNNLLSGPKTWFGLSVASPTLNMIFDGSARFAGGAVMAMTGDKRGFMQMVRAGQNLVRTFQNVTIGLEYAWRSLTTGRGTLMPGVEIYDGKTGVGAIRMEGGNDVVRTIVNGTGNVVRAPSRAIMTFDEFFRQVNARTALQERFSLEAHDELMDAAIEAGTLAENPTPRQIREWRRANGAAINKRTRELVDQVISDGRIRDQHAVIDEAMNDPRIMGIEDEYERARAVQEYFTEQFTDTHRRNVAYAKQKATDPVFQGEMTGIGESMQRFMDEQAPLLRYVIPFFRTPWKIQEKFFALNPVTNIPAEALSRVRNRATSGTWAVPENSNLGRLHAKHLEDLGSGDPRRIAEARGRQAMGSALVMSAWSLADSGTITGGGPRDWQDLKELKATGWQPYSFRYETGEVDAQGQPIYKYVSYLGMDPYAQYLALLADAYYLATEEDFRGPDGEKYNMAMSIGLVMARQIHEKPYIQGISNVFRATGDPERFLPQLVENVGAGFIPFSSMSSQLDYATDPYVLEARTMLEGWRAKSYLWADDWGPDLEPRYNGLGERIDTRSDNVGNWTHYVWNRVFPFRVSVDEMDGLDRILYEMEFSNRPPSTLLSNQEITGGGEIDLLEVQASPQLIEALGVEDFSEEWSVYAAWQERIRTMRPTGGYTLKRDPETGEEYFVEGGMTLNEAMRKFVEDKDVRAIATWEETGLMGLPIQRQLHEIRNAYREAALAWVFRHSPELDAANRKQLKEQTETIERNLANTHPDSPAHNQAREAVERINQQLQELTGEGL